MGVAMLAAMVAATETTLGRWRGKGTGPRSGSPAGRISVVVVRIGSGGAGASRGAVKSGGLVAFGLGQAIPRSAEAEAVLSFARGACGSRGTEAVVAAAVIAESLAGAAGEGASVGVACSEAAAGTEFGEFELGSAARLRVPFLVSPVGFGASLAPSARGDVRSAALGV